MSAALICCEIKGPKDQNIESGDRSSLHNATLPGMGTGQPVCRAVVPVDLEFLGAVHTLQVSETLQRHLGCARHKLYEPSPVSLVKRPQCSPEPLDL